MPQINDIRELAQQNAGYVSNSPQDWMSYLDVAARLYRYSFTDTLLIHAQRPDATACAELELWNQKMSRWVNRGAKGIALLDDTGPRTKLRYVFDIADTHLVRGGRTPLLWNLDSHEHEQAILDHLEDTYGLSLTDSMNTALMELAQQLTADNLDEAMDGLAYEVAGTFLEELDEDNIRVRFRELMTNSIFYTLSRRCGQEPMDVLDDDDFIRIVDFNKLPVLSFLGNAVSEQCEAVLFDIGREMRKIYKKEITQQLEKSVDSLYNTNTDFNALKRETKENTTKGGQENGVDVLPQGRLSVPESGREGRAADHREVRDAAQDVPEREPQELVSEYADERQTEPASGADRGSSGEPGGNPAGQPEREVSGTEQGEGPAGMGGTPEQPDGDGRRDRLEGIGVQLTEPTTEQDLSEAEEEIASAFSFPDLPTVEQQIRAIEAPIQARYADEIALDSEVVDEILRTGSNRSKGQLRLIYNFMVEKTPEEYTEFVKNEYGTGGKGFEIGGAKYAVWFDDLGLRIAAGDTAKGGTIVNAFLSWEDVSNRIHELLRQGEYAPQAVLDAARQNALQEHAQTLAYMERDLADGVAEAVFQDTEIFRGGFPELTDRLAGLLDDADFLTDLNDRLSALGEAYAEDKDLMRMHFYKPDKVAALFQQFAKPYQNYSARDGFHWNEYKKFITEDEINAFFTRGSDYSDSRLAIYSFFLNHEDKKERADFLKEHYGIGGSSHALCGADDSHEDHDGRGIALERGSYGNPYASVHLNWNQAAGRIDKLIRDSEYLKPADYSRMPAYECERMAMRVMGFYHHLPNEVERPYPQDLYHEEGRKALVEKLADPEQATELLEQMDTALLSVPMDSEEYERKAESLSILHQYVEGTYTIFPEKKRAVEIVGPEQGQINKDTGLAVLNENGEPEMERVEYVIPRFRVTTVFDVSQTDGEPIPSLEVNELTASVKDYALLTAAIEQVSPVPMRFDEIEGDAKGYYSDADKEICIQVGMGESQTIKTMIHEVAHAMLHNSDLMKQRGEEKDRLTKETEAESIAFTVCSALGIDTSDYSFPYVASWASGKEMKELKDSMDTIRLTAADFLEKLETAVAERSAERMTAMQYAEKLIVDKEQEKTIFDDEQRNLIVKFAFKLDDRAATEELVNGIAAALAEDDKEEANRLMYEAQEKIENLPDRMIGLSEMHDYGYRNDDMLPLMKEAALEWHRAGEKIYPLFSDGTAGEFASKEQIAQHDGIFGIRTDAWQSVLLEQQENYLEDDFTYPQFPFSPITREQALQLYDEGKQIYLVRTSLRPTIVTERAEIERGSDVFQIATADLELEHSREESLLQGSEKQFGIYQITERDPEHNYRFMGLDYVEKKGMTVARADYDLIYTALLTEKDTLDGIYERFNIQRPADFTGHSLSVSDVVVLNDGSTVKAYYVDSIGFAELPEFFKERNLDLQKENLLNEELQEIEIFDKPGLFSNGRLRDEEVPEGLYRYDLRGSDYDPGQPITVEKTVVVNHAASVLMVEELDLGAEGRLELGEEGLNFTGAELTVREFMEKQQQKNNALIHGDSDHIAVEGHLGTWYAVDETEIGGEKFFLLEHEEHGDMAACVAVDEQGKLVAEDLWNGFDDEFLDAVKEYLSEKWNMPNKDDVVSEIIEKAAPVPDNSAQDYSDVPVYYEPFSYAKENDEVDLYRTSYRLNGECKQAIHEAIADNYDGMHLGDDAVNQVVKQYGMERVGYILANTLRYKNYDDRFSHSNKEWAEQVGTPENNARIIKFRADWVVTSHSAVLDGFVTMYREKLEKQKELKQPFVKRFYVVENRQAVPLEIKRFGNLNDAMSQYQVLPNHYMKALGVEKNPDPLPGSLDILQCRNGLDTIVEDYKMVPGWNNPYIQNHIVQPLQGALAVQDVELAYELPDAYFHIQTCDDGFDYTLYNKDFTERDGGILETDGDKPVQEAMTELLAEFGCDVAQGRVMDAAELREQADMVAEQQAEVLKEKLAAERPAPEETLSFYVAECLEFTFAGEFHDHLTMEEALEAYDKIPSERMNADKCIGFCIEEDGGFVGMYELVVNDKVQRENINSINYFRDDKLVQQAISDMEKLMAARQQNKEQERSSTKKSVLDALHSLKAKKQEQPAQEQDKPKKAKTKGMEL